MANFDELLPKVSNWDVEEEEMLINKIKTMTEDYQQKCSDLSINLNNINRNLHLIQVDFFNTLNGLKTLSGTKFVEHVVNDEINPEEQKVEETPGMEENIKDEHFNNINNILQRSFDFIALREQQKSQNKNNQEDDTISMNSKLMDNNLTKNNRGLKLPLIIGTNDFLINDYIGLVNDEDEEEEDFNNEIKNDISIPVPPENAPGEVILNNKPEDFHNMIQQNMGKPIQNQSMFDEENKENEKEFMNPALAMEVDEQEDAGLGGLLRSSSIKKPNINNQLGMQMGIGMNNPGDDNNIIRNTTTNFSNMRLSAAKGKGQIKLANFLGSNFFDDDEDDDGSGLFSRPQGSRGGLGMSMVLPGIHNNNLLNNNNNQMMNTQMLVNQNIPNQNILNQQNNNLNNISPQMSNIAMPGLEDQNINTMNQNININQQIGQQQISQEKEKLPLNQRMVMVPNPLLLAMKQQNIQAKIEQPQINPELQQQMPQQLQPPNLINTQNIEEQKNNEILNNNPEANSFQDKRKNLEKLFNHPPSMPTKNSEILNQNILTNPETNIGGMNGLNLNMDTGINFNTAVNPSQPTQNIGMNSFLSKREIENNQKLENAKSKLNSIFGDDDEDEDDLFSKKGPNQTQKIEEKSQNLEERLHQLTSTFNAPSNNLKNNNRVNDLFSMDQNTNANTNMVSSNNILNNNLNVNTNTNFSSKKKKAFFDDDDDDDFTAALKPKPQPNTQINDNINQNIQVNQNIKNEPRIIVPKPMEVNLFQTQNQMPAKKKISLFDDMDTNETSIPAQNINIQNNKAKAPSSLFDGIDTNQKPEIKPQQNPIPNNNNPIQLENQKKPKLPSFFLEDEEAKTNVIKPIIESQPKIQQTQFLQNPPVQPQAQISIQKPQIMHPLMQPQIQPKQNQQIQHPLMQPKIEVQIQNPLIQTQVQNAQIQQPQIQPQISNTKIQQSQIQPNIQPQISNAQIQQPQISNTQILSQFQAQVQPQIQPQVQAQVQPQIQPQVQAQVQPQIQPQVQTQVQPQVQKLQNKQEQIPSQVPKKPSIFDNLDTQKPVKKKASLFDILDAKPSTVSKSTDTNNNNNNLNANINKEKPKEEKIPGIIKPEEAKGRLSVIEDSSLKKKGNKMASKFEQMLEEQRKEERKSVHTIKPPPKKLDFASKISNLQNVLGGRMAMGGNVFTMPTGGIKTLTNVGADIVHDEVGNENIDNENKTEIKDISAGNSNAIIEEAKIQETSYEKQLEKKKENTVVVKKKKPKRIQFQDAGNENMKEEIKTEQPKVNEMFNFENNNSQAKPVVEQKPKETVKIDLFAEIKPKEQKPISMNDLFKVDNNQSNPPITTSKINNIFEMDINKPKTSNLNMNNLFADNNNATNQVNDNLQKKENNNINMNNIFNMEQPKSPQNINNIQQNDVQKNLEFNNISNNFPNSNQPVLNINKLDMNNSNNINNIQSSQFQNNVLNNTIPNATLTTNIGNNNNQTKNILLTENNNNQNQPSIPENKPIVQENPKPKVNLFADIKPQVKKPISLNNIFDVNNTQSQNQIPPNSQNNNLFLNNNIDNTQQKIVQPNININNNLFTEQPKVNSIPSNINNIFMDNSIKNEMNMGNNINLNNQINQIQQNTNQLVSSNINVSVEQQPLLTTNININQNNNQNSIPQNNIFYSIPNNTNNSQQIGQNILLNNNNINQNQPSMVTNNLFAQQNSFQQNSFNQNEQIQKQQQSQNIFIQDNNLNLNQNNQQTFSTQSISVESNQPKKQFKSMFEDDDDEQSKKKEEINIKNPIADKRLSFLFDDD